MHELTALSRVEFHMMVKIQRSLSNMLPRWEYRYFHHTVLQCFFCLYAHLLPTNFIVDRIMQQ
jgi:hypothetical protein